MLIHVQNMLRLIEVSSVKMARNLLKAVECEDFFLKHILCHHDNHSSHNKPISTVFCTVTWSVGLS